MYTEEQIVRWKQESPNSYVFFMDPNTYELREISESTYAELHLIMTGEPYVTQLSIFNGEYYCVPVSDHYRNFYCSSCDELIEEEHSNYCPNCGVKLKKDN